MRGHLFVAAILAFWTAGPGVPTLSTGPALHSTAEAGESDLGGYDPEQRVTLELHDAKISDLVATLGVMTNLPVYVDSDVDGTISIKVHDTALTKVLQMVSRTSGVWIRIENGKLVASRSTDVLFSSASLPPDLRGAPRMLVADYDRAKSETRPLYATIVTSAGTTCYHYVVQEKGPPSFSGTLGGGSEATPFYLTQFVYEPVSKARYFVLEYGHASAALAIAPGQPVAYTDEDYPGGVKVTLSEKSHDGCQDVLSARPGSPSDKDARYPGIQVLSPGADGASEVVMAPRVALLPGTGFFVSSEVQDDRTGQHRQLGVRGYLTRDGRSLAAILTARAIWRDPADGREYYYVQPEKPDVAMRLHPLTPEGETVGRLRAGVATPRPLELKVFSAEKTNAADGEAGRSRN